MSLLSLRNIDHRVESKTICKNLSLTIEPNDRIALVGLNGSGKSTLLKIIAGILEPDEGIIARQRGLIVEYVPQILPPELAEVTLFDALLDKVALSLNGRACRNRVEKLLEEAKFERAHFNARLGTLSGGETNRALFARARATDPALILLDEPTNHMDTESVCDFEGIVANLSGTACIIVSHDRALLDETTNRTVFLRDHRLHTFDLPYSQARDALQEIDARALSRRNDEEKEIDRLKRTASRLADWGKNSGNDKFSRRAKSMEKRIARNERELTFVSRQRSAAVSLDTVATRSEILLAIENMPVKIPDGRTLFQLERLQIRAGDRIALLGRNGCGKSTFLRQVVAAWRRKESSPYLRINPSVTIGYYDQELRHFGDEERIFSAVKDRCVLPDSRLTSELVRAGFPYPRHNDRISILSGGERSRLTFLILHLSKPSLLILDEPTNHLDVHGIEELETQLLQGSGACLFVSHDRRFVDRVTTRTMRVP